MTSATKLLVQQQFFYPPTTSSQQQFYFDETGSFDSQPIMNHHHRHSNSFTHQDANGFAYHQQDDNAFVPPASPERNYDNTFSLFAPATQFSFTTPPREQQQQQQVLATSPSNAKKQLFPTAAQSPPRPAPIQKPPVFSSLNLQAQQQQQQQQFSPPASPTAHRYPAAYHNSHSVPSSPNRHSTTITAQQQQQIFLQAQQQQQYPQSLSSPATPQRFHHGSRSLDDVWWSKKKDEFLKQQGMMPSQTGAPYMPQSHHQHYGMDTPDFKSPWSKADGPAKDTKPINLTSMGISPMFEGKKQRNASTSSLFTYPLFGEEQDDNLEDEELIMPIPQQQMMPPPQQAMQQHPAAVYQPQQQQYAPQNLRYSYPPVGVAQQHQTPQQYAYNYQQQQQPYQQRKYPAPNATFVPQQTAPVLQAKDWADPYLNPANYQQQQPQQVNTYKTSTSNRYQQQVPVAAPIVNKRNTFSGPVPSINTSKSLDDGLEFKSQKHKDFLKAMKEKEKLGYWKVKAFCEQNAKAMPDLLHWKVCMDLADIAKRENLVNEARYWYQQVNALEPKAPQGWLEHAKLEEESGELEKCDLLLRQGLEVPHCKYNESLIIKYIKLQEQKGNLEAARQILARLKHLTVDKSWKIILEGALLESRSGNVDLARKIFKYLMANVPRHGPIYYEAYRLEEKCEKYENAISIVKQGLQMNARYGPLWFAAFHLMEKLMKNKDLTEIRQNVEDAVANISKELVWKVYFEAAQIEERANNLEQARAYYVHSVDNALDNLRWKVWLAGSRTELNAKNIEVARLLLNRALTEVPSKSKAVVLIECARLEEYVGNLNQARAFLKRAQKEAKHEWKVFLESILLEMRAGEHKKAIEEAVNALEIHRGTGRLWAVLIQLKHIEGEDEQLKVFKEALEEVPKSGEVWCEGARIRLNPLSPKFNLTKARRYLEFAIKFTPQYGDSLIEYQRLELLQTGPKQEHEENKYIEQLCVNADPNYGPLWVHCKEHPLDSTRQVLRHARELLMKELLQFRHIYQKAIVNQSSKTAMPAQMKDAEGGIVMRKDFITGLHSLNSLLLNPLNASKLSDYEDQIRKKFIFGSELSL